MVVDKDLSIPLYKQIKKYLETKIDSGEWEVGYKLPAEKELATRFQVSNITVKRAILDLVNEGILHRKSGKGTFVKKREEHNLASFVSVQDEQETRKAYPHKTLGFKTIPAEEAIARKLGIDQGDMIYMMNRLKIEGQKPTVIEFSYVPEHLAPELSQNDIENELLYNIFSRKYKIKLDRAKVYISTMTAKEYEASTLGIDIGDPLFVLERFTTTATKQMIEYSKLIMLFEDAKYYLEVQL
ncbi:GntR family transcriptional regulator [Virgibacillus salexigens]|uniref:HTH-type transcriptional repressor YvoA n=2 Tax=Virgibacillus TaxID=84406 RepID=A0A024Q8S9_9BACI|nr:MULTISPECIES: GntR family transcriptional regulator [Virgibacillus]GGJ57623.1 HTH-type transcriptional repressor YvoA [Virgibacillus kapii]CDQ38615.1 HTH-type transcriptional repressor YvoA [Virgibacillus massiliensis]